MELTAVYPRSLECGMQLEECDGSKGSNCDTEFEIEGVYRIKVSRAANEPD